MKSFSGIVQIIYYNCSIFNLLESAGMNDMREAQRSLICVYFDYPIPGNAVKASAIGFVRTSLRLIICSVKNFMISVHCAALLIFNQLFPHRSGVALYHPHVPMTEDDQRRARFHPCVYTIHQRVTCFLLFCICRKSTPPLHLFCYCQFIEDLPISCFTIEIILVPHLNMVKQATCLIYCRVCSAPESFIIHMQPPI